MMHLAAYYQSVNPAGALTQLNAVTDQSIFTSGVNIRVPTGMGNLLGEAALSAATTPVFGQVQSPTLRDLAQQDIMPVADAVVWTEGRGIQWHGDNPRDLTPAESVNLAIQATGGAAAANYGLIWMADGPVKPTSGKIFTVRGTGASALAAGTWVNTAITFNSTLPAGTYQVVGFRASGANLVAARIVFVGAPFRPGIPGDPDVDTNFWSSYFRDGAAGVFGAFDVNQPPTIDCLGATDTTQAFAFDLIKSA